MGKPLPGGQAVAWWAKVYGLKIQEGGKNVEVTSQDIDFWGSRDDVIHVAKGLGRKPIFPNRYEMTVWAGAIPILINDQESLVEFLHTVPGLDTADPEAASVPQTYDANGVRRTILVLTSISMVLAKVHCLRHFKQDHRNDKQHLRVCIAASRHFIRQLLREGQVRHVLWNCERLISLHQLKPIAKLEKEHGFSMLDAIPIADLRPCAINPAFDAEDRDKISNFVSNAGPV